MTTKSLRCLRTVLAITVLVGGLVVQSQGSSMPKPKVRAITAFIRMDHHNYRAKVSETLQMLTSAKSMFEREGYEVQTIRISTQPFNEYTDGMTREDILSFMRDYDALAVAANFHASIGPLLLKNGDENQQASLLGEILRDTKMINSSIIVARERNVDWKAVEAAAHVMKFLEENTEHSQGNFRFSAIANVPPLTPFFPGSYHNGAGRQFTIALQSANLVDSAFSTAPDRTSALRALTESLTTQTKVVEDLALAISHETGWEYMGTDLSPAPLGSTSIGAAIEALTKLPLGASGTLTVAAEITAVLKTIPIKHAGYSGLMLPVLEDERLAQRWSEGRISLDALLGYSAVCGTGLDVVPLPGEISETQLARIIGDVASLSAKWDKPLSARLLPFSGKKAGERTDFASPYLENATIQPLSSQ
jgi:uncharacterized protein (UPF0210 family)